MTLSKTHYLILIIFLAPIAEAASFRSVLSELFGNEEELSSPIISCDQEIDESSVFTCDQNFTLKYRGDYRLFITLEFNDSYETEQLPLFQDLSREERDVIHKDNATSIFASYSISDSNGNTETNEIMLDMPPTTLGATLGIFEIPNDFELDEPYTINFNFPNTSDKNSMFYQRYKNIHLMLRRLSSISR